MKCSTMMAILCCGALAFAVAGCRYDDPNADDLANSQDVASEVPSDDSMNAGKDIDTEGAGANAADANADETSLSNVTGLPSGTSWSYEQVQTAISLLEDKMDSLNTISQDTLIQLQSLTAKRDQTYDLVSNVLKSLNTVLVGTVNNL